MAKVTRIKASDGPREEESKTPTITRKKVVVSDKKTAKKKREAQKVAEKKLSTSVKSTIKDGKSTKSAKSGKKPFILFRPFVALWHYLRDSWKELRQVRWPNRKATWQLVFAVIVYSILFIILISLLDMFFSWLFNLILNR